MARIRPSAAVYLVWRNLLENPLRTLACLLAVAFAVAVVAAALALNSGLVRGALDRVEAAYPREVIVARPKSIAVAMLALPTRGIDAALVEEIGKLDGVASVAPQTSLRVPLRAEIDIAGQTAVTDAVIVGVEPELVDGDVDKRFSFAYDPASTQPIPTVAPRFFLDMYNLAYADSMGLPKVNEDFVLGKTFKLVLGETFMFGGSGGEPTVLTMQVVGLSANPTLMSGLMIPLEHARVINRTYGRGGGDSFTAAHIRLASLEKADSVTSSLQAMGLTTESNRDKANAFLFAGRALRFGIGLFAIAIAAFAAFTIFNSYSVVLNERRTEIGLMRAVGASRGAVSLILLAEVAVTGLAGALLGLALTGPALAVADGRFHATVPTLTVLPPRLFALTAPDMILCMAAGITLTVAAALPVILRTTSRHPASLVAES